MKTILSKRWSNGCKYFNIISYEKSWKEHGIKPTICVHSNKASRRKGDSCLDLELVIGYTVFNYTNYAYNRKKR